MCIHTLDMNAPVQDFDAIVQVKSEVDKSHQLASVDITSKQKAVPSQCAVCVCVYVCV